VSKYGESNRESIEQRTVYLAGTIYKPKMGSECECVQGESKQDTLSLHRAKCVD